MFRIEDKSLLQLEGLSKGLISNFKNCHQYIIVSPSRALLLSANAFLSELASIREK